MHTYCAEMRRVKTVNDTAGVLMKERHAQMKQIVSHFVHQVSYCSIYTFSNTRVQACMCWFVRTVF